MKKESNSDEKNILKSETNEDMIDWWVPDVSINKLSTFIGNHVRHRILPDHHHFE